MMGVLQNFFWFFMISIMLQSIWCEHQEQAAEHRNSTTVVRRDTAALSYIQALYNTYKSRTESEVTYYGKYPGGGACALDPLSPMATQKGWIRVAAGRADFQNSLGCGMCVEITGSGKGSGVNPLKGTVKAIVHDLCGGCKKGGFDLYTDGDGRWEVTSRSIDCPTLQGTEGNIMFRFTGSNAWYIKLQARNIKIPAAGIEVLKNGKYSCLKRTSDNYFTGDVLGKVKFPMKVRVTSISGEQLEAILPSLRNDANIPSVIQFGGIWKGRGPSQIKCFGQGNKSPYPAGGMNPSEEAGSSPGVGRPSTTGSGNRVPTGPTKGEESSSTGRPSGGIINKGGDFCESRESGVHPDPDDCQGFILCDAGKTYRKKCSPGLLFNPKHLVCDLPHRVKCRPGSQDWLGQAQKREKLAFSGKPAVEIVILKEKAQDTHKAPNTEGMQAIRPNEELNAGVENGKLATGTSTTPQGSRVVVNMSKEKEDGNTSESRVSSLGQRPGLTNNTATGAHSSEDRMSPSKDEGSVVTVMNTNNTFSHNSGQESSQKVGNGSTNRKVLSLAGNIGKPAEHEDGQDTPFEGVNGSEPKGSGAPPMRAITNISAATSQSVILTEMPHHKFGNKIISQHSRADTLGNYANLPASTSAAKGLGMRPGSEHGGALGTTWNAAEREKQGIAPTQLQTANAVPLNVPQKGLTKEGSVGTLQPGTQNQQELEKGSPQVPSQQGTQVSGQPEPNTVASEGIETHVSSNGSRTAGVLSRQEASNLTGQATVKLTNSDESSVHVVTLEGLKTIAPSKPAVSMVKETPAPLVGITIKQAGQPDKYVLLNKRHKLHTKQKAHA